MWKPAAGFLAFLVLFVALAPSLALGAPRPVEADNAAPVQAADFTLDPCGVCNQLTFEFSGPGSGRVQSTDANFVPDGRIDCLYVNQHSDPAPCTNRIPVEYPPIAYFIVTPAAGSRVMVGEGRWETEPRQHDTEIPPDAHIDVVFDLLEFHLVVSKAGSGSGSVAITPLELECGSDCLLRYGTEVLLTAIPASGSTFKHWTGACTGQPKDCLIAIIGDTSTTAVFASNTAATGGPGRTNPPAAATSGPGEPTLAPEGSAGASPPPASAAAGATGAPLSSAGPGASPDAVPAAGSGPPTLALVILGGAMIGVLAGFALFFLRKSRRGAA